MKIIMKKLIIIAVLFCLSAMIFKTEAQDINEIRDKEFIEFFKSFQKELKESKGECISNYIDCSLLIKKCKSNEGNPYEFVSGLTHFTFLVKKDFNKICNLSKKNKYDVASNKYCSWWLLYNDDNYIYENYGVRSVYNLYYGNGGGSTNCIFAKIDDEWKIIWFFEAG